MNRIAEWMAEKWGRDFTMKRGGSKELVLSLTLRQVKYPGPASLTGRHVVTRHLTIPEFQLDILDFNVEQMISELERASETGI